MIRKGHGRVEASKNRCGSTSGVRSPCFKFIRDDKTSSVSSILVSLCLYIVSWASLVFLVSWVSLVSLVSWVPLVPLVSWVPLVSLYSIKNSSNCGTRNIGMA